MDLDLTSTTEADAAPDGEGALDALLTASPLGEERPGVPRIMVVEGRVGARAAVLLSAEGLSVETTYPSLDLATEFVTVFDPHLVVLEVVAVDRSVVHLCERLDLATNAPIVVLCEQREEADMIAGYAAGARSIVAEPVGAHELVARIRALLRRTRRNPTQPAELLIAGPITLDRAQRVLTVHGQVVPVPRREFDIATMLLLHCDEVVSRSKLLRELWGSTADAKSLAVQVGRLRGRLAAIEGFARIITVRGVGYRFVSRPHHSEATITDSTGR